jgi:DNA polymerase-3 subunit beta
MKFSVQKNEILEALRQVISAVPTKTTLQVLSNIQLSLKEGLLTLTATDLDLAIQSRIAVQESSDGELLIGAQRLFEVIRASDEVSITFNQAEGHMNISMPGGSRCRLPVAGVEEFPKLPDIGKTDGFTLKKSLLSNMTQKVIFAVSTEETRMALRGVFCELDGSAIKMVATDSHRLGLCEVRNLPGPALPKKGVILPPKALNLLLKNMGEDDQPIAVNLGKTFASFATDSLTIITKLLEGTYPNYEQVIPKNNKKIAVFKRSELMAALQWVSVLSNLKTRQVKFKLEENQLEISTSNRDLGGDAHRKLTISYQDSPLEIGFNAIYFLEILRLNDCEEMTMALNTALNACIIAPTAKNENQESLFLIMPLRLLEEKAG